MKAVFQNNKGDLEVDPFNKKGQFEEWMKKISTSGEINYHSVKGISAKHSEMITRYVLDLSVGKNTAKGYGKGPRSYVHLVHVRFRLASILRILEKHNKKYQMDFTEDEVLATFNAMRKGSILNFKRKPFLDVSTYAKVFCAFWRWYTRIKKNEGITIPDIVTSLDTSADHKPVWHHFTIREVEKMADITPSYEYRALFLSKEKPLL